MGTPIGVLVAVSRATYGAVLASSLRGVEAIGVVGLTQGMGSTANAVRSLMPDVVILDVFSRDEENLSVALTLVEGPESPHVIVLGHSREPISTRNGIRYLPRAADFEHLTEVILSIDETEPGATTAETSRPLLTPAERRVAALVAEGYPNRRTGQVLHLSENTVRNYLSNVLAKLGLANRTELAAEVARSDGLILEQDR